MILFSACPINNKTYSLTHHGIGNGLKTYIGGQLLSQWDQLAFTQHSYLKYTRYLREKQTSHISSAAKNHWQKKKNFPH